MLEEDIDTFEEGIDIGVIEVTSGVIKLGDPIDTPAYVIENAKDGEWAVKVDKNDGVIVRFCLIHTDHLNDDWDNFNEEHDEPQDIPVDTAKIAATDGNAWVGTDEWYQMTCQTPTDGDMVYFPDPRTFVIRLKLGDGTYPIDILSCDGKVVLIEVVLDWEV